MAHNVLDISNPSGGAYDGASGSGVASTLVGGKYTTTPPTSSDGQVQTFRQDINGRLLVSLGTLIMDAWFDGVRLSDDALTRAAAV